MEGGIEAIKADWEEQQNQLKQKLITSDEFGFGVQETQKLKLIGAMDISYHPKDEQKAVAALMVLEYPSLNVVYEDYHFEEHLDATYIAGFLAFKEVPMYKILVERLKENKPELWPQIVFVDGNGMLHPRGFGSACQIGVIFDVPTIGVAKNLLHLDGIDKEKVKTLADTLQEGGSANLVGDSGTTWGAILRCTKESAKPIFISIGHRVSLDSCITLTKLCSGKYRVPEPIRQADLRSREKIR